MCGRYQLETEEEIWQYQYIIQEWNAKFSGKSEDLPDGFKTGEIAPTDPALVLTRDGLEVMRWGFSESFTKAPIFNAREDKVWESRLFADSAAQRRIVVPTSGFYEWKSEAQLDLLGQPMKPYKVKYLFKLDEEQSLFLGGFYKQCILPNGEKKPCFTILTTNPNDSMKDIHDRMPVILRRSELNAWMTDKTAAEEIMMRVQPDLIRIAA